MRKIISAMLALLLMVSSLNAVDASTTVSGYLPVETNVRTSPNGRIVDDIDEFEFVKGTLEGNWIKLRDNRYIYNFGLLQGTPVEGYFKTDMNIRTSPNGRVVRVLPRYREIEGIKNGNWIALGLNRYVYASGLSNEVEGYYDFDVNVRRSPNGSIIGRIRKFNEVEGHKEGNWIRLDDGEGYVYAYPFNNKKVSGFITKSVNVRDTDNGRIEGIMKYGEYVEGTKVGNYIVLDDDDEYIYDFGLQKGRLVSGRLKFDTYVRETPNGKIDDVEDRGEYVRGYLFGNWIAIDDDEYIHKSALGL